MTWPQYMPSVLEQRGRMCEECMSETCAYAYKGVCHYPLVFGTIPGVREDGCNGFVYKGE